MKSKHMRYKFNNRTTTIVVGHLKNRPMNNQRRLAAELAQLLYDGSLTFIEFSDKYPDSIDDDIKELFDLIEHEPKKGGLFGVSEYEHYNYIEKINTLIEKLKEK
jgi:hypothetical protein